MAAAQLNCPNSPPIWLTAIPPLQTRLTMSRPDVAVYAEHFFTRLFCASDDSEAVSTINAEIAEDADMVYVFPLISCVFGVRGGSNAEAMDAP